MPSRLIILALVPLLALVAGCGGQDLQPASSSTDAAQLLRDTVASSAKLQSGALAMTLKSGAQTAQVSGPFASEGKGKLPRFALSLTASDGAKSTRGGVTWTGEKGFITIDNTSYAVSDLLVRQLEAGFEQAASQRKGPLGLDVTRWVKDPRNEGPADVAGAQTIKITGQADPARILADVQALVSQAGSFGLGGAVPKLSPQERQEYLNAVQSTDVAVYSGADDRILRRLVVNATVRDPDTQKTATFALDLTLTHVNEQQQIAAPKDARPFSALLSKLGAQGGGLSLLGG